MASHLKKAIHNLKNKISSEPNSDNEDDHHSRSSDSSKQNGTIYNHSQNRHGRSSSVGDLSQSPARFFMEKLRIRDTSAVSPSRSSPRSSQDFSRPYDGSSKAQQRKQERRSMREHRRKELQEEIDRRRREIEERAARDETPEQRLRYGLVHANAYALNSTGEQRIDVLRVSAAHIGCQVTFRARIHSLRRMGAKLVFFVFRQQTGTIQGVLQQDEFASARMLYWAEHLGVESIVLVRGVVQQVFAKEGEVISASVHDAEIRVREMHVEAQVADHLPFTVQDAEVTKQEAQDHEARQRVSDRARIQNRVLNLRTSPAQSIFRVQSAITHFFREFLDARGFIEIHTPKLQGGATESGASVFKVDYFGRTAFLAQSPQLAKQMSISADFGKVYEIGPVFRAENSNTHRHLTEFTGMDIEMAIDEHYHEVLRTLDGLFKHIFKGIYERHRHDLEVVKRHFPHEDLVWLDETPRIPFKEAVRMLNESGWRNETGEPLPDNEDLGTRDEIQLGVVIKQKLGTDFYIIDKFPTSARPFYAMEDPEDPNVTNGFDIFLRGQEILSGGQRIHDARMLVSKMEKNKIDPRVLDEYVNAFEWGAPPHGGGGIGLERMLMLLLNLGDIRHASLFPRDPKSLPARAPVTQLRHPEASTVHPPWEGMDRLATGMDFQPLEKLIANYGDASNTSWLEERNEVWRDPLTGAAVGFAPIDGFAITIGDPLCHTSQYKEIIGAYLQWVRKERRLKPLWLLVGPDVEEILAERFNWRTFSVAAEQRLDPSSPTVAQQQDHDLQRKMRAAERAGVHIRDIALGGPIPDDLRARVDDRIADWLAHRKQSGRKQVHMTELHPWQDIEHRQYHIASDAAGTVCAVVVLAQLAPAHGWQVKYALDFPGAPSGAIELIVTHALRQLAAVGVTNVTFGGGASAAFTAGHNLRGARVKVLAKMYKAIATELKLTAKSEFREKMGAHEEPVYVCYPPHGLGGSGIKAIMKFFEDDD